MRKRFFASIATQIVLFCSILSLHAFPIITNVVETGGDNTARTPTAKFTGQTFTSEPEHSGGYTVPVFGEEVHMFVDRVHQWNGAQATNPIPAYLMGGEYIMSGNENRENPNYRMDVSISGRSFVYLLIDWRLGSGNNAIPPEFGPTNMQWVLDDGWLPVTNGMNRFARADWPDEIGADEGGDGVGPGVAINQYAGIYMKVFEPGTFTLRHADNGGRNMYGVVVVAASPPPVPAGIVGIAGDAQASISWDESGGARAYIISRSDTAGGPYTPVATNASTLYVDSVLVNGSTYYYVVAAEGAGGTSENSSEIAVTPANAPSDLVAEGGPGQVSLSWTGLSGALTYNIGRSSSPIGPFDIIATEISETTYVDATVSGAEQYYYVVTGVLEGGALSGQSDAAVAVTVPNVPSVTASMLGATALQVRWSGAGPLITSYVVEQSVDGGASYNVIATPPSSVNRIYITEDIFPDSQFFFRVAALNDSGGSEFSEPVQVITPTFGVAINFANPTFATNFPGYLNDHGAVYGDRGNGFVYGWEIDNLGGARERNSAASPDKRWDTLNHWQRAGAATNWQIELPNGFYLVRLGSFDPTAVDSRYQHDVEGVITPAITPVAGVPVNFEVTTMVTDGQLTITSGPLAANNKINFIEIYSAIPVLPEISVEPQDIVILQNRSDSVSVELGAGSTPLDFQWYQNGVALEGQTSQTLSFNNAQLDQGGDYEVVITNPAGSVTSRVAVVTITPDVEPPSVESLASVDGLSIGICFNEIIDGTPNNPMLDPFNYLINDGSTIAVAEIFMQPDNQSLRLVLTGELPEGEFEVTITQLLDLAANSGDNVVARGNNLGLETQDIGAVTHAGSHFACDQDEITVVGGGSDVWANADQFHAIYQMVDGNFDASVQVTGLAGVNAITKAVLVARESTNSGSAGFHISGNPLPPGRNQVEAALRATTDGATAAIGSSFAGANIPNFWMRISRQGDIFTLYRSTNGTDWISFGSSTNAFTSSMMVGFGVTAHDNTMLATGTFSGFNLITTLPSTSDLGIEGSTPSTVNVGQEVSITLTVTNGGPDAAQNVQVTGPVSANISAASITSSQGLALITDGELTADLGTIEPNSTATITITGTAATVGHNMSSYVVASASVDENAANSTALIMFDIIEDQEPVSPQIDSASVAKTASSFSFSFNTQNGVEYQFQSAPSVAGPWTTIDTITGDGNPAVATDAAATEDQKFYRILIEPSNGN